MEDKSRKVMADEKQKMMERMGKASTKILNVYIFEKGRSAARVEVSHYACTVM